LEVPRQQRQQRVLQCACQGNTVSALTALFGVLGFVWTKLGFPAPPLLLGFVLGPMMEEHLRRAMLMAKGDPTVFVTRPISLAFIVITAIIVVVMVAPVMKKRRGEITG
jgi:TctA family transporter